MVVDKINVSLFLPNLHGGGAERIMMHLANGLAERGHRVDFILVKAEGPYLADLSEDVNIVDLGVSGAMKAILPLARYLRAERPDVLVSALDHTNIAALLARRLSRVSTRVIAAVHSTHSIKRTLPNIGRKAAIMRVVMKWCYPRADAIVAVSHGVADDVVQVFGVPRHLMRVVYNPVITTRMRESAKESVGHPWLAPSEPGVILAMGSLRPVKDFPTLIRAFALLLRDHDVRLLILGEGEERPHLEQLVADTGLADHVVLPGFVQNPFAYLARSSLFVLSSLSEALPTALIEALALGVPVVSTNCRNGPGEILDHGRYGRLVAVGDAEALAHAMGQALSEPIVKTPEKHLRQFTLPVAVDNYLNVIRDVIDA